VIAWCYVCLGDFVGGGAFLFFKGKGATES